MAKKTLKLQEQDNKTLSKEEGVVRTNKGEEFEPISPAAPEGAEDQKQEGNLALTEEELEGLAGDLEPGDKGFLPLDKFGRPSGPAQKTKPEGFFASVYVPIQRNPLPLATPSGAEVTNQMNPDPTKDDRDLSANVDRAEGEHAKDKE